MNNLSFRGVYKGVGYFTALKVGNIDNGNYAEINNAGEIKFYGESTQWTDFTLSATRVRQGALNKPDFDYTNLGLLFPQNDTDEKTYAIMQMSHQKKLNTAIKFHIHYIQTGTTKPTYKVDYRFYNNGDTVPGSWTTLSTADGNKGVFNYSSGSILQIATFPEIPAPVNEGVSANLEIIVYRDDNDVTGDVLTKYFDFHYQIDSFGSNEEYIK